MQANVIQGLSGRSPCPVNGRLQRPSIYRSLPKGRVSTPASSTDQADTASANGAASGTTALDFDELTELIKMVHETDIVELELKSKKFSLAVRKKEALEAEREAAFASSSAQFAQLAAPPQPAFPQQQQQPAFPQQQPQGQQQQQQQSAPPPSKQDSKPGGGGGAAKQDGVEVNSPMAGTFYRSPAPGEPPFVRKGDKVTKGQTVAIIEAMKMMNEIEADVSGEVVDFIADNGKPVTIGQPLILIKP